MRPHSLFPLLFSFLLITLGSCKKEVSCEKLDFNLVEPNSSEVYVTEKETISSGGYFKLCWEVRSDCDFYVEIRKHFDDKKVLLRSPNSTGQELRIKAPELPGDYIYRILVYDEINIVADKVTITVQEF